MGHLSVLGIGLAGIGGRSGEFIVIPFLGFPRYLIHSDRALAQVMNGALKVTKASLFTVISLLGLQT